MFDFDLNFEGRGFDYVYTKALNRGKAEVIVDGRKMAVIDLSSKIPAGAPRAGLAD